MEASFWHKRWENNEIGFHEPEVNPDLTNHWPELNLPAGSRVFVPLCGKTRDIGWLLSEGYRVAGAELSELAVRQLFDELGVTPEISNQGKFRLYQADNFDIFVGDIFELTAGQLGPVDASYDRAALIALPETTRPAYTRQLIKITHVAPQLLITLQYDTALLQGPPFHISTAEVPQHYGSDYDITLLQERDVEGGLKGVYDALVNVWALRKKND